MCAPVKSSAGSFHVQGPRRVSGLPAIDQGELGCEWKKEISYHERRATIWFSAVHLTLDDNYMG
jgi:hypothetical protein